MRKEYILGLLITLIFASCTQHEFVPQDGDLLFCVAEPSEMSDAIVDATKTQDVVQYDHVAMFATIDGKASVIEASPKNGVVCRNWEDFLSETSKGSGIVVMRINQPTDIPEAINRAKELIGQPYDWSYLPNNQKIYCSELIYESYLDENGEPIFTANPMNFKDTEGNFPQFWIDVFNQLGEPIPQGIPGTNPNDLSKETILEEVHRYF